MCVPTVFIDEKLTRSKRILCVKFVICDWFSYVCCEERLKSESVVVVITVVIFNRAQLSRFLKICASEMNYVRVKELFKYNANYSKCLHKQPANLKCTFFRQKSLNFIAPSLVRHIHTHNVVIKPKIFNMWLMCVAHNVTLT